VIVPPRPLLLSLFRFSSTLAITKPSRSVSRREDVPYGFAAGFTKLLITL